MAVAINLREATATPPTPGDRRTIVSRSEAAYIPEIDALRAVAVISVIVFHMNASWLPGGYTGVDVFFGISGYVISSSIFNDSSNRISGFLLRFYARRVLRIIPALLVCLFVTTVLTTLFIPESWLSQSNWMTARYAFMGLSNLALMRTDNAYFDPRAEFNPYTHTWSLGIEEQFYLVFPTIFFVWMAFQLAQKRTRFVTAAILPALLLLSLADSAYVTSHDPGHAYYELATRFWELSAGALLFRLHVVVPAWKQWGSARIRLLQLMLSASLIVIAFFFTVATAFPFPWGVATIVGTVGLIDALLSNGGRHLTIARVFRSRGLVWIGKRSYSLYLWHWPIYVLLRWTVGLSSWTGRLIALSAVTLLSIASYEFVERPFRHIRASSDRRRSLIVAGAIAAVLIVAKMTGQVSVRQPGLSLSVTAKQRSSWYPEQWVPTKGDGPGLCRVVGDSRFTPNGGRVETYRPEGCTAAASATRLFVTGNSHARAYTTMLSKLASTGKYDVRLYTRQGCEFLSLSEAVRRQSIDCQGYYRETLAEILRDGRAGDIFFLPSLRLPRFADQWARFSEAEARKKIFGPQAVQLRHEAVAEVEPILRPVLDAGISVIFEAPKPIFRAPAYRCADWFNKSNPICAGGLTMSREVLLAYRHPLLAAMQKLEHSDARIRIWDPFDTLCPGRVCRSIVGGVPLFFDGDHLSAEGNKKLYPGFVSFISKTRESNPVLATTYAARTHRSGDVRRPTELSALHSVEESHVRLP